ncbi:KilA-N domain-containing protein [Vibrio fluvialis]|nr:KilA-N domain-containing protein [Vibrio fluvialis]
MPNLTIMSKEIRILNGLYSLNDLHKASGNAKKHQPHQFLRNDQTRDLISEIDRSANSRIAYEAYRGGKHQGTWVCKELVYAYAM